MSTVYWQWRGYTDEIQTEIPPVTATPRHSVLTHRSRRRPRRTESLAARKRLDYFKAFRATGRGGGEGGYKKRLEIKLDNFLVDTTNVLVRLKLLIEPKG